MFYEEASEQGSQCSNSSEDEVYHEEEGISTNEEDGPNAVPKKSQSLRMDDFFPLKKILRPAVNSAIEVERRTKVADEKIGGKLSKFARKRKIKKKIETKKAIQKYTDVETLHETVDVQLKEFVESQSQITGSDTASQSKESVPEKAGLQTPVGKPTTRESIDSSAYMIDSSLYTTKDSSIPSLSAQLDRINQIKRYDSIHGTYHATVVKATKAGIQCEVCEGTYIDISSFFRLNKKTNEVEKHTHIGSITHQSNMATRKRLAARQPSLYTLLEDINPTVDRKVIAFRFEVVRLLLSLRVPLAAINSEVFKDFVNNNIG